MKAFSEVPGCRLSAGAFAMSIGIERRHIPLVAGLTRAGQSKKRSVWLKAQIHTHLSMERAASRQ